MAKSCKIFCVECGKENKVTAKKCIKCHKNPNPKEHAFKDYVWGKMSSGAQDEFFKQLKNYILSHLYGIVMSCSLVFTGVAIINNVVSGNHVDKVTERPTYEYVGAGLSSKEVVEKYAEAIKENDFTTVYGLQLSKTRSDIYKEIMNYSDNSSPGFGEKKPIKVHTMIKFGDIYFNNDRSFEVYDATDEVSNGNYGDYKYYRYNVVIPFCGNGACMSADGTFEYSFWLTDQVEVVEIDGNSYITGEKHHYEQMNLSQIIARGVIYNAGGDMTKVNIEDLDNPSLCGDVDDCLSKFGGMEVEQEW